MNPTATSDPLSPAATTAAAAAAVPAMLLDADEDLMLDFSKMKKKKKAKKTPTADAVAPPLPAPAAAPPKPAAKPAKPAEREDADKSDAANADDEDDDDASDSASEGEDHDNDDDDDENDDDEQYDENNKQISGSNLDDDSARTGPAVVADHDLVFMEDGDETHIEAWLSSDRDYKYEELLDRVVRILQERNPNLVGGRKKYTMVPPQVLREGSKKTAFANFADICMRMRRSMEHVTQFLYNEMGTSGSIDGAQRLIIKGRFQQKQLENVLRRYIVEYVTCKTCKSPDTKMEKKDRLYFVQCASCGSRRSVSAIKTGARAQTKDSRRAAKAQGA